VDESLTSNLLSNSNDVLAFVYAFIKSLDPSMFKLTLRRDWLVFKIKMKSLPFVN
jgi:hypothetical protein